MRTTAIVVWVLIILSVSVLPASSQLPYLALYFDSEFNRHWDDCPMDPPYTVVDSMFVVAVNLNSFISAIEYRVEYPPEMVYIADYTSGLCIGNSPQGMAIAWPYPQNGYSPLLVAKVLFIWNCQGCSGCMDRCICPQGHPGSGSIRAVSWPDNQFIYMTLQPGRICLSA